VTEPGPERVLPGRKLAASCAPEEAAVVARRAAVAFVSGDAAALRQVFSITSPQLARCTLPHGFMAGRRAEGRSVEVMGSGRLAVGRVEVRYHGASTIGADSFAVILQRERERWTAFAVTDEPVPDDLWPALDDLWPALDGLSVEPRGDGALPAVPRLVSPPDGGTIGGPEHMSLNWSIPDGAAAPAFQVCQVLLNEKDGNWPTIRFKVYPGEPRARSLSATGESLTGVRAHEMSWCVWNAGSDGRMAISEVRGYKWPAFAR
jgi:hypothetical protein